MGGSSNTIERALLLLLFYTFIWRSTAANIMRKYCWCLVVVIYLRLNGICIWGDHFQHHDNDDDDQPFFADIDFLHVYATPWMSLWRRRRRRRRAKNLRFIIKSLFFTLFGFFFDDSKLNWPWAQIRCHVVRHKKTTASSQSNFTVCKCVREYRVRTHIHEFNVNADYLLLFFIQRK